VLSGDLTIAGTTTRSTSPGSSAGSRRTRGKCQGGFEGGATLNRKDWGLVWNAALETGGFLVSDKIKLVLEIEAARKPEA